MSDIENKIKKILSVIFLINENKININSSNQNIEQWDSLKQLSLILAIEEEFNIHLSNEETLLLVDFKSILKVVRGKVKKQQLN